MLGEYIISTLGHVAEHMDDPGTNGPGRVIFVMTLAQSGSYTFTDPGPKKQKMIVVHVAAGDAIMFRGKYRLEWIHGGTFVVSKIFIRNFFSSLAP